MSLPFIKKKDRKIEVMDIKLSCRAENVFVNATYYETKDQVRTGLESGMTQLNMSPLHSFVTHLQ